MVFLIQRITFMHFQRQPFHHLPAQCINSSLSAAVQVFLSVSQEIEHALTLLYISSACIESGSDKHSESSTHMHEHTHRHMHTHANDSIPRLSRELHSVFRTASLRSYIIKWGWLLLWGSCTVLDGLTDCVRGCNPIWIG